MDSDSDRACQIFDGVYVVTTFGLSKRHYGGAMASFNGRPTVVGGYYAEGAVEKMTDAGWSSLSSHPRSASLIISKIRRVNFQMAIFSFCNRTIFRSFADHRWT